MMSFGDSAVAAARAFDGAAHDDEALGALARLVSGLAPAVVCGAASRDTLRELWVRAFGDAETWGGRAVVVGTEEALQQWCLPSDGGAQAGGGGSKRNRKKRRNKPSAPPAHVDMVVYDPDAAGARDEHDEDDEDEYRVEWEFEHGELLLLLPGCAYRGKCLFGSGACLGGDLLVMSPGGGGAAHCLTTIYADEGEDEGGSVLTVGGGGEVTRVCAVGLRIELRATMCHAHDASGDGATVHEGAALRLVGCSVGAQRKEESRDGGLYGGTWEVGGVEVRSLLGVRHGGALVAELTKLGPSSESGVMCHGQCHATLRRCVLRRTVRRCAAAALLLLLLLRCCCAAAALLLRCCCAAAALLASPARRSPACAFSLLSLTSRHQTPPRDALWSCCTGARRQDPAHLARVPARALRRRGPPPRHRAVARRDAAPRGLHLQR